MPKRIFIRDGGLTSSVPVPAGYTVLGSDNGTPKKQVQSTISDVVPKFQYEIGEYVPSEGGVIYHRFLTGTTQNYLVVDTQDLAIDVAWSNITNSLVGATSMLDGLFNSNLIVNQPGHTTSAAKLCLDSTRNGKSDWYLPSILELIKLFDNIYGVICGLEVLKGPIPYTQGVEIMDNRYWSSTEIHINIYSSYAHVANRNDSTTYDKGSPSSSVRAVRKFTIGL